MGIRELIAGDGLTSLNIEAKGFAYPQQGGQGYGGFGGHSTYGAWLAGLIPPSAREYAAVNYSLSSALAVCLNTVTNAFPEAELCVEREIPDGEDERLPKHPALMLMERPSPYFSGDEITAAVASDLMTSASGSAYIVKRRNGYKQVSELWAVSSSMMRPVWPTSGDVFISAYEITIDGVRHYLDPRDVIHFRNVIDDRPPSYGRCGKPYLPPIMQDIYSDMEAGNFTSAIMKNMGLPGVIISPKALVDGRSVTLPTEIRDQFAQDFDRRFTGAGRGRAMVTGNPIDVQQLGFDPEKMSLREIRHISEERISAIYNIPAIVAGFGAGLEHGSFENTDQSFKMFWLGCMVPMQRRIAQALTNQFLRVDYPKSESLYFQYEHDHIKVLQESETEKRERDREDYLVGGLTAHQYVSRLGLVPEGPDYRLLPANVVAYPVDVMPTAPELEPAPPQLALPPAPDAEEPKMAKASLRLTPETNPVKLPPDPRDDLGKPLGRTPQEIEDEAQITDEDIAEAEAWFRDKAPDLADFLDSTQKSAPLIPGVEMAGVPSNLRLTATSATTYEVSFVESKAHRWNPRTQRYYGDDGKIISKAKVTEAVDAAVEVGRAEMAGYADALIAGEMDLPAYQIAMEQSIKRMHIGVVATTRGGWSNLTARERGQAAQRIQVQYRFLNQSCLDFANGDREVNGRVRATSQMYASSARVSFNEASYDAAKDASEAQPGTHEERWVRHAGDSCEASGSRPGCIELGRKGWVPLGTLPQVGDCTCLTQCRCEKVVRRKSRRKDGESS